MSWCLVKHRDNFTFTLRLKLGISGCKELGEFLLHDAKFEVFTATKIQVVVLWVVMQPCTAPAAETCVL
jgi:hypothetical protein